MNVLIAKIKGMFFLQQDPILQNGEGVLVREQNFLEIIIGKS